MQVIGRVAAAMLGVSAMAACGGGAAVDTGASADGRPLAAGTYCDEVQFLQDLGEPVGEHFAEPDRIGSDPQDFEAVFAAVREQFDAVRSLAPDHLAEDYAVVASGLDAAGPVLERVGYDLSAMTRALEDAMEAAVGSARFAEASDRIDAYDADVCTDGDAAAQADLRNAMLAAEVFFIDNDHYRAHPRQLEMIEPTLHFAKLRAAAVDTVGFAAGRHAILLVTRSSTGRYYCISNGHRGAGYGSGDRLSQVDSRAECSDGPW